MAVINVQTLINLETFAARVQITLSPAKVAERVGIPGLFDLLSYWKPCRDNSCDAPIDDGCCPAKARSLLMLPEKIEALGFTSYNDDPRFHRVNTLRAHADFQVAVVWATEAAEDVAQAYIVSPRWPPHDWKLWDRTVQTLWFLANGARENSRDGMRPWSQRQAYDTMAQSFEKAAGKLEAAKETVMEQQLEEGMESEEEDEEMQNEVDQSSNQATYQGSWA